MLQLAVDGLSDVDRTLVSALLQAGLAELEADTSSRNIEKSALGMILLTYGHHVSTAAEQHEPTGKKRKLAGETIAEETVEFQPHVPAEVRAAVAAMVDELANSTWAIDLVVKKTLITSGRLNGLAVLCEHFGRKDGSKLPVAVLWKCGDKEWTKSFGQFKKVGQFSSLLGQDAVRTMKLQVGDTLQLRPGCARLRCRCRRNGQHRRPKESPTLMQLQTQMQSNSLHSEPRSRHCIASTCAKRTTPLR